MTDTVTEGVQSDFQAWLSTDAANLLAAYAAMFEQVFSIVNESGSLDDLTTWVPAWSTLMNVETCPTWALPFLSMFNGTAVQPGTSDAVARATIQNEPAMQRGTVAAIEQAVLKNLTGDQSFWLVERTANNGSPDAYHAIITYLTSECPSPSLLQASVEAIKPAGIQITYLGTTGITWNDATGTWSSQSGSWNNY